MNEEQFTYQLKTIIYFIEQETEHRKSGCCRDCDGFEFKLFLTPISYVEISNKKLEKQTIIIGYKELIPHGVEKFIYGSNFNLLNKTILQLKKTHSKNVELFRTTLPAYLLTLVICLNDDYFRLIAIKSKSKRNRFYKILISLPLELQKIICNIHYLNKFKLEIRQNFIELTFITHRLP